MKQLTTGVPLRADPKKYPFRVSLRGDRETLRILRALLERLDGNDSINEASADREGSHYIRVERIEG